ncbi:MAG: CRISPR-associated endonuclease Cas1 [Deferribacteres bacterium]|nr:CRISPR-associated endonuclease Cas1 [candidate division KSB1 bacterium]MCB9500942.1 CRISPR-associated endonuclease Cas1 [Deferribacteres bacterium]
MPTLYLIEQNTTLRKSGERLLLCRRPQTISKRSSAPRSDDILMDRPCADVDQVMLFGNVQVTIQAMQQLLTHDIELAIFTYSGRLLGQLTPPKSKNIPLRLAQFDKFNRPDFKLLIAKTIVSNKIATQLAVLRQHRKNYPEDFTLADMEKLEAFEIKIHNAASVEQLLGFEGSATAAYFSLFATMFKPPWQFSKRSRRPPKDPVNAVLSYGYVIVGAELQALLDGVGFDPYLGFYHSVEYGRPSLALDMLEEFRHSFIDRLALNLFNLNILKEADFVNQQGGYYLNTEGKKKFFQHFEKMLGEYTTTMDTLMEKKGIRAVFQQQVNNMMKAVLDEAPYTPWNGQ